MSAKTRKKLGIRTWIATVAWPWIKKFRSWIVNKFRPWIIDKFWPRAMAVFRVLVAAASLYLAGYLIYGYKNILTKVWSDYENILLPIAPFAIFLLLFLWIAPKISVRSLRRKAGGQWQTEFGREKERLILEDNSRKTLAQIIGGIFVIGSLIMAYNTYTISVAQLKITQEGQLLDRYTKAISQLENDHVGTRVNALYALEQVAKYSSDYHWGIMDTIFTFIREKSPKTGPETVKPTGQKTPPMQNQQIEKVGDDIQTALTVIGRRKIEQDPPVKEMNLSRTNLKGINLSNNLDLSRINFKDSDLSNAVLTDINLSGAKLTRASLSNSYLANVTLADADLSFADLKSARLSKVYLTSTELYRANFSAADLSEVENLSLEQLMKAIINEETVLPKNFQINREELLKNSKAILKNEPNLKYY